MRAGGLLALWLIALAPGAALAQGGSSDSAVDERIRASAAAAESYQGPLDGGWTLAGADGQAIYAFQISDKPGETEPPEGVWRDLRHPPLPGDISLIDVMVHNQGALNISFYLTPGGAVTTIVLKAGADGVWSGEMTEGGQKTAVTLRRTS